MGHYSKAAHDGFSWKLHARCAEEEVEDLQRANCETLDSGKSYSDALANAIRANFNRGDDGFQGRRRRCHLHGIAWLDE